MGKQLSQFTARWDDFEVRMGVAKILTLVVITGCTPVAIKVAGSGKPEDKKETPVEENRKIGLPDVIQPKNPPVKPPPPEPQGAPSWVEAFRNRYWNRLGNGNHLLAKIVDDRGNGYEPLYGARNVRVVLHGILYRGGANNAYHRSNRRSNMNPLPTDGLQNLCAESFGEAIYLYSENYSPQTVSCASRFGASNTLRYSQISVLGTPVNGSPTPNSASSPKTSTRTNGVREILNRIYSCATGTGDCPIYTHCWNGWHASGLISAVALRQFCNFSPDQAEKYWIDATDSLANSNYPSIKASIREFRPVPELSIPTDIQNKICPQHSY
jgi:hypothetical protein